MGTISIYVALAVYFSSFDLHYASELVIVSDTNSTNGYRVSVATDTILKKVLLPIDVSLLYFRADDRSYSFGVSASGPGIFQLIWGALQPVSFIVNNTGLTVFNAVTTEELAPQGKSELKLCTRPHPCPVYTVHLPVGSGSCTCLWCPVLTTHWDSSSNLTVLLQSWSSAAHPGSSLSSAASSSTQKSYRVKLSKVKVNSQVNLIGADDGTRVKVVEADGYAPQVSFGIPSGQVSAEARKYRLEVFLTSGLQQCVSGSVTLDLSDMEQSSGGDVVIEAQPSPQNPDNLPIILGAAIGGVFILVVVIASFCAWFLFKRRRRNDEFRMERLGDNTDQHLLQSLDKVSPPSVLLVYSYDCSAHAACVQELAVYMSSCLRCNVSCELTTAPHEIEEKGGKKRWYSDRLAAADYVIVVCSAGVRLKSSASYRMAHERESRMGRSTNVDSFTIASILLTTRVSSLNFKTIAVLFDYSTDSDVPPSMDAWIRFTLPLDRKAFSVYFADDDEIEKGSTKQPLLEINEHAVVSSRTRREESPPEIQRLSEKVSEARDYMKSTPNWLHTELTQAADGTFSTEPAQRSDIRKDGRNQSREGVSPLNSNDRPSKQSLNNPPPQESRRRLDSADSMSNNFTRESPDRVRQNQRNLSERSPRHDLKQRQRGHTFGSVMQSPVLSGAGESRSGGRTRHRSRDCLDGGGTLGRRFDEVSVAGSVASSGGVEDLEGDVNFIRSFDSPRGSSLATPGLSANCTSDTSSLVTAELHVLAPCGWDTRLKNLNSGASVTSAGLLLSLGLGGDQSDDVSNTAETNGSGFSSSAHSPSLSERMVDEAQHTSESGCSTASSSSTKPRRSSSSSSALSSMSSSSLPSPVLVPHLIVKPCSPSDIILEPATIVL